MHFVFPFYVKRRAFLYFSCMSYIACVSLTIMKFETRRLIKHLCRLWTNTYCSVVYSDIFKLMMPNKSFTIILISFTNIGRRKLIKLVLRRRFNVGLFILNSYTTTKIDFFVLCDWADYWPIWSATLYCLCCVGYCWYRKERCDIFMLRTVLFTGAISK
jgi:hypothetical protein